MPTGYLPSSSSYSHTQRQHPHHSPSPLTTHTTSYYIDSLTNGDVSTLGSPRGHTSGYKSQDNKGHRSQDNKGHRSHDSKPQTSHVSQTSQSQPPTSFFPPSQSSRYTVLTPPTKDRDSRHRESSDSHIGDRESARRFGNILKIHI